MRLLAIKNRLFSFLLILPAFLLLNACEKYEDLPKGDYDADGYYCNDARAINYNVGFPGIANDSICVFPVEPFEGNWTMIDTLLDDEMEIISTHQGQVSLVPIENDSIDNLFIMEGYCDNNFAITFQANRYLLGMVFDNIEDEIGHFDCDGTSILTGFIAANNMHADTIRIQMRKKTTDGELEEEFWWKGIMVK